jgi:hypothetical protein
LLDPPRLLLRRAHQGQPWQMSRTPSVLERSRRRSSPAARMNSSWIPPNCSRRRTRGRHRPSLPPAAGRRHPYDLRLPSSGQPSVGQRPVRSVRRLSSARIRGMSALPYPAPRPYGPASPDFRPPVRRRRASLSLCTLGRQAHPMQRRAHRHKHPSSGLQRRRSLRCQVCSTRHSRRPARPWSSRPRAIR